MAVDNSLLGAINPTADELAHAISHPRGSRSRGKGSRWRRRRKAATRRSCHLPTRGPEYPCKRPPRQRLSSAMATLAAP